MLTYMTHCSHESLEVIWARKPSTIGEIKEVVSLPEPDGPPGIIHGEPRCSGYLSNYISHGGEREWGSGVESFHQNCEQSC